MRSITIAHLSVELESNTIFLKRDFLSNNVVRRRFYKHSFLHRDILQVLNPFLLETHA